MFQAGAWLISQFYSLTSNYAFAIALVAIVVMLLITPLTLKSTKGMLEMQRLQPEMRRLQAEHKNDRQKLNEEMMKLYQSHKVNPLASCLPLLLQMPVFIVMFRVLHGLTRPVTCAGEKATLDACANIATGRTVFDPDYISHSSDLFQSLKGKTEMLSFGLDLGAKPADVIANGGFGKAMIYTFLVVVLAALYYIQQRMVASRAAVSPTMSATQAKIMQYLPVAFAFFQLFFITGLVIYYITQALFRIGQNAYITKRFYSGDESLGRQALAAGQKAREEAEKNGGSAGAGGLFAQVKKDAQAKREAQGTPKSNAAKAAPTSKRVTPAKSRPTPSGRPQRPQAPNRPQKPSAGGNRSKPQK